jgi:23S rRNA (adenine2503-C2)-methyltransferase
MRLVELELLARDLRLEAYRARQIFAWVHARGATSAEQMTDLPREVRGRLAGAVELAPLVLDGEATAPDGTRKLRLRAADGALVETVLIPEEEKLTQCVSTQVGCALGCRLCATATMGFLRNLTAGEIVDQIYRARALLEGAGAPRLSNLVFMGMGEPLANLDAVLAAVENLCSGLGCDFSPRRITVSTAGLVPRIEELGRRAPTLGLAVSLNATTDEVRSRLMPVNRRWPLPVLLEALRRFPLPRRRRITIEYVLVDGLNDTPADARRLPALLDRIPCKVNLIPFNETDAVSARRDALRLARPSEARIEAFAEVLRAKGLQTTVRRSRGAEVLGACGQLVCRAGGATTADRHLESPEDAR